MCMINLVNLNQNNIYFKNRTNTYQPKMLHGLNCDTVSFKSKNLLSKSPNEITKIVQSAIKDTKNLIGQGSEGKVFDIPETNYCVKIPNNQTPKFEEWNFDMYNGEDINHTVAVTNNVSIMKKIAGETLKYGKEPKEIYDLPKETFKTLLKQINNAHKKYMVFDAVPRNIIYNKENKSLTAIDFIKEDPKKHRFSPFYDVYDCLKSKGETAEDKTINAKFGEKLFSVAVDSLSDTNKSIPLIKKDLDALYKELSWNNCLTPETEKFKSILDENIKEPEKISLFDLWNKK